jgi:hypothetical protein
MRETSSIIAALPLTLVLSALLAAGQQIPQPRSYGLGIDPAALTIPCLAELDRLRADDFVAQFGRKSASSRWDCTSQLLAALTPEPAYTAEEFRRSLVLRPDGSYSIDKAPDRLLQRMGMNAAVSSVIRGLVDHGHLRDERVIEPLVDCVDHPLLSAADNCDIALSTLTKHHFKRESFQNSSTTEATRRQVVELWREFSRSSRRRIYDRELAGIVGEASTAIGGAIRASLPLSPQSGVYLPWLESRGPVGLEANDETLRLVDVGSHNAANWPGKDPVQRVGLLIFRPGAAMARASEHYRWLVRDFVDAEFQERFDALDLEVRVDIKTTDAAVRGRAVDAVSQALAGLRRENTAAK